MGRAIAACTVIALASCRLVLGLEEYRNDPPPGAGAAGGGAGGTGGAPPGTGGAAEQYAALVLADAPLLYWRLGEAQPPQAVDAAGDHDGSYIGGVTLGEPGALAGDADTAATFDGFDDLLEAGDVLDFPASAAFSLEAWVKPANPPHDLPQCILAKQELVAGETTGYSVAVRYGEFASLYFSRDAGIEDNVLYVAPLEIDVYSHVVATFDGFTLVLYVNGREVGALPSPLELGDNAAPLQLAVAPTSNDCVSFAGSIDEVAIYDTALYDTRVVQHYSVGMSLR